VAYGLAALPQYYDEAALEKTQQLPTLTTATLLWVGLSFLAVLLGVPCALYLLLLPCGYHTLVWGKFFALIVALDRFPRDSGAGRAPAASPAAPAAAATSLPQAPQAPQAPLPAPAPLPPQPTQTLAGGAFTLFAGCALALTAVYYTLSFFSLSNIGAVSTLGLFKDSARAVFQNTSWLSTPAGLTSPGAF
jgi:hypothetical protein